MTKKAVTKKRTTKKAAPPPSMFRRAFGWLHTNLRFVLLSITVVAAVAVAQWWHDGNQSAPISVTPPVRDYLTGSLEHYHDQRMNKITISDAVEAFILNASPVLKQPERGEEAGNREQEKILLPNPPEPVKKESPVRRGIFRRR